MSMKVHLTPAEALRRIKEVPHREKIRAASHQVLERLACQYFAQNKKNREKRKALYNLPATQRRALRESPRYADFFKSLRPLPRPERVFLKPPASPGGLKSPSIRLGSVHLIDAPPFLCLESVSFSGIAEIGGPSVLPDGGMSMNVTAGFAGPAVSPTALGYGDASCWTAIGQIYASVYDPSDGEVTSMLTFTASPTVNYSVSWDSFSLEQTTGELWIGQVVNKFDLLGNLVDTPINTQGMIFQFDEFDIFGSGGTPIPPTYIGNQSGDDLVFPGPPVEEVVNLECSLEVSNSFLYGFWVWMGGAASADGDPTGLSSIPGVAAPSEGPPDPFWFSSAALSLSASVNTLNLDIEDLPVPTSGALYIAITGSTQYFNDVILICVGGATAWSQGINLLAAAPNATTAPALAFFNGQLFAACVGGEANGLQVWFSSNLSLGWTQGAAVGQSSSSSPSLAVFNSLLFLSYLEDPNLPLNMMICNTADGQNWNGLGTQMGYGSLFTPSLAPFNGSLFAAFVGKNSGNNISVIYSPDGQSWWSPVEIGQQTQLGVSLAAFGDQLYLAFVGPGNQLFVCSSTDGRNWTSPADTGQTSQCAPSLTVYGGQLFMAFIDGTPTNSVRVCSSPDGINWLGSIDVGQSSACAPSIVSALLGASTPA